MDVETVLLSIEERDNWVRRVEALQRTLKEVRERLHRSERKLRRIRREVAVLANVSHAVLERSGTRTPPGTIHAAPSIPHTGR